jgi:hypothetical protein
MKTPYSTYLLILPLLSSSVMAAPKTTTPAKPTTKPVVTQTATVTLRDYADPDGAWALRIPQGWKTEREALGDGVMFTQMYEQVNNKPGAAIHVAVIPSERPINPEYFEDMGTLLIGLGGQAIDDEGEIIAQKSGRAVWNGREVIENKILFRRDDDKVVREGVMMAMMGKKSAFLVMASAPQKDVAGFQNAQNLLLTLALESKTPADVSTQKTVSLLNKNTLRGLTSAVKDNLKREPKDKVLVQGEPPLTYGSIAAYGNMLSKIYDVELTETEFNVMRQTFIDVYKTSDAKGKADVAGWDVASAKILTAIDKGTVPKAGAQQVFKETFEQDAAGGNAWAKVILNAIEKRSRTLAITSAKAPKFAQLPEFDNQMSEADLEAAVEMLTFMWVAAGRDASLVDEEAVTNVSGEIVSGFTSFPAELQYILANAQQLYAGMRTQWQNADAATRRTLAQKYSKDLDALGLTVPSTRKSDAWSDFNGKDRSTVMAETVVGLAGSSYKSAW